MHHNRIPTKTYKFQNQILARASGRNAVMAAKGMMKTQHF
jgi:hypothetical protein